MRQIRITRVDKGLAVRLPTEVVRELDLREGECMMVRRIGTRIAVERAGTPSLRDMLRTVREPEAELDSGLPIGREVVE